MPFRSVVLMVSVTEDNMGPNSSTAFNSCYGSHSVNGNSHFSSSAS